MVAISRRLTCGELAYAKEMFGTALDYDAVHIHNTKAYFFQPSDIAMTPDGDVYFPEASYKSDFSTSLADAAWLIHELTHAWQHQQKMWVRMRGMFNRNYLYGDIDRNARPFLSYGIEQQASIVADCFRLKHGLAPNENRGSPASYERLIPFLPESRA